MHGVVQLAAVEEISAQIGDVVHAGVGGQPQQGQQQSGEQHRQGAHGGHVLLFLVEFPLPGWVLFQEQAHIELGHVGQGHAAGDQEEPFHHG